jgi:hypothetical protein
MDVLAVPEALARPTAVARIVVLTDFTPASNAGIRTAARLAGIHAARSLRLLHVLGPRDFRPDELMVNDASARVLAAQRASGCDAVAPTVVVRDGG